MASMAWLPIRYLSRALRKRVLALVVELASRLRRHKWSASLRFKSNRATGGQFRANRQAYAIIVKPSFRCCCCLDFVVVVVTMQAWIDISRRCNPHETMITAFHRQNPKSANDFSSWLLPSTSFCSLPSITRMRVIIYSPYNANSLQVANLIPFSLHPYRSFEGTAAVASTKYNFRYHRQAHRSRKVSHRQIIIAT